MSFGEAFENVELSQYKWVAHIDRLTRLAKNEDVFPVTVELDLVSFCNHNCGWCVDPLHKGDSLDPAFISELLNELKSLGVEGIVFKGGGEPTLHRSFTNAIEEARILGFEVGIVTNGSRLRESCDKIVRNASYLRVSIDGPTPELHWRIHKSHDFERIIDGVQKTVQIRNRLQQRHPVIGLSFAIDYSLIDWIYEAIGLGDRLGVNYILLRPPFFEEVGRENTMSIEKKRGLLSLFEKSSRSYKGDMKIFVDYWISDSEAGYFSSRNESPRRGKYLGHESNGIEHITGRCLASPLMAVVTADKKVYPCCNLRFLGEWSLGRVDYERKKTFRKIWGSERREEVMDRIHRVECLKFCTHPLSRYNEVIEYLKSPQFHKGFV